jgi:eukaryotic-like serine/threonine-protein kinase
MTPSIKPEHPVQIGQRFLGKYEILKHLGRGGMGTVFEARHLLTGASWAIKFLFTDRLSDPTQIRDFHREARLISMVNHPNVVKVVDFDIVSESSPQSPPQYAYMVMELLAGVDMAKILRRENPGKTAIPRPMDPTRFMILTRQILTAIDTIHSAGIVHHDLKPANIMVIAPDSPHEFVKVCDFGIAALLDEPRDEQAIKGTPYYMSPERIQNLVTDNRSDIYALGIIFYEMLAGVRPFSSANTPDVFRQHLEDQPRPIHNPRITGNRRLKCSRSSTGFSRQPRSSFRKTSTWIACSPTSTPFTPKSLKPRFNPTTAPKVVPVVSSQVSTLNPCRFRLQGTSRKLSRFLSFRFF